MITGNAVPARPGLWSRVANHKKREVKFGEMIASGASASTPALRLCRRRRVVAAGSQEVRLPDLSFRLLDLLASRAPDNVSYDEIEHTVWNAQVTRETIKQRVKLLRESLAPLGASETPIEAVRNVGYRTTLEIGLIEPRPWRFGPPVPSAWIAAIIVVATVAILITALSRSTDTIVPPTLLVESAAPPAGVDAGAWEGARRMLVRDLSKVENIRVIDRPAKGRETPALLARLALDRDSAGLRLTTELVDSRSGSILLAENYRYDPRHVDRAFMHFTNNAHAVITGLSLQLGSAGFAPQPGAVRASYARAFRLWRQGDRQSLDAASSILQGLLAARGEVPLATSLLARVKADLVLSHGADIELAQEARRDTARLVTARPDIGEFRYSLARALLALGEHPMALEQLRIAQQTMPFLSRDVQALERRVPETSERAVADPPRSFV